MKANTISSIASVCLLHWVEKIGIYHLEIDPLFDVCLFVVLGIQYSFSLIMEIKDPLKG